MKPYLYKIRNKIINDPLVLLRLGLGIVFLLAGIHRVIFFDLAYKNFIDLNLNPPALLVVITIILELITGTLLIINRFIVQACVTIMLILTIGIIASIIRSGYTLIQNINEIFILTYTSTNIILHLSYFIGIVTLLLYNLKPRN
ncbi:DoxX family protein [Candidatus Woesearchaeota archaeon]|nr:DoxX family protein [Candidatus Woesearchaeota archaeon]